MTKAFQCIGLGMTALGQQGSDASLCWEPPICQAAS